MTRKHQEQNHPQENKDSQVVNSLLQQIAADDNLLELARLLIRYQNFPGARDIQKNLQLILQQWQLTEESLYEKTRQIYASGKAYQSHNQRDEQQDWS